MTDDDLQRRVGDLKIIARARPLDKKRLVEALQRNNEVVAVTGDGTNDAPALKTAHVGLSMGDGTSVAKEASDITIIDNSFTSIGRAVMWGRSLYLNIQRFVLFQMTVNVAACLIVLAGAFMGLQSPLTVTQMLWVNLIMDTFAAMALASLAPTPAVMHDKPRPRTAFIVSRPMWASIIGVGAFFFFLLLGILWYFQHTELDSLTQIGRVPFGANTGLTPYELSLFFTIFVFLQFWNLFNARAYATGRSALHFKGNAGFTFIVLAILVGQIAIVELGREFFNVVPLKFTDWVIIIGSTSLVLWVGELLRLFSRGKYPTASKDNMPRIGNPVRGMLFSNQGCQTNLTRADEKMEMSSFCITEMMARVALTLTPAGLSSAPYAAMAMVPGRMPRMGLSVDGWGGFPAAGSHGARILWGPLAAMRATIFWVMAPSKTMRPVAGFTPSAAMVAPIMASWLVDAVIERPLRYRSTDSLASS